LTEKPIADAFFIDNAVAPARRYRYTVVAVDTAGNVSQPSPEAVAETF
jgi:chitodextrinase